MGLTAYQAKYYAYELQRSYANDHVGKLAGLFFDAQVEPKPHQIDAALFALQTPYLNGVILADEVGGLGVVGHDAADLRRREKHVLRPFGVEESFDRILAGKIEFGMGAQDEVLEPIRLQLADDGRAHQAAMPRDVHTAVVIHLEERFC